MAEEKPILPPACERVLQTAELLEAILLELPMVDLLLAQAVCKTWQDIIQRSTPIQRALFLAPPSQPQSIAYLDWRLDDKSYYEFRSPYLKLGDHLRGETLTGRPKPYASHWGRTRYDIGRYRVFVNPLLAKVFPVLRASGLYDPDEDIMSRKGMGHPKASWRSMYFTQPPSCFLAVEYDGQGGHADDDEDEEEDDYDPAVNKGWTVMSVRAQDLDSKPFITMARLAEDLSDVRRFAWIEGREMWRPWTGARDIKRVVVAKKSSWSRHVVGSRQLKIKGGEQHARVVGHT